MPAWISLSSRGSRTAPIGRAAARNEDPAVGDHQNPIFLVPLGLLGACLLGLVAYSLKTGRCMGRGRIFDRRNEPALYWLATGVQLVAGILLVGLATAGLLGLAPVKK